MPPSRADATTARPEAYGRWSGPDSGPSFRRV